MYYRLSRRFPREPALQVLDAIDAGSSALIVAPTSSGKTFISSYCINSVVARPEDPEGIVVFVAPNKALVNQVAAQVRPPPCGTLCRCEAVPAVRANNAALRAFALLRHAGRHCRVLPVYPCRALLSPHGCHLLPPFLLACLQCRCTRISKMS